MQKLNSYKDLQDFINGILKQNGDFDLVGGAPHGYFWNDLDYHGFTTGNVPGVDPPTRILLPSDSAHSNLIMVLNGTSPSFAQMPDGGTAFTNDQIASIADWIDRGCPNAAPLLVAQNST